MTLPLQEVLAAAREAIDFAATVDALEAEFAPLLPFLVSAPGLPCERILVDYRRRVAELCRRSGDHAGSIYMIFPLRDALVARAAPLPAGRAA